MYTIIRSLEREVSQLQDHLINHLEKHAEEREEREDDCIEGDEWKYR